MVFFFRLTNSSDLLTIADLEDLLLQSQGESPNSSLQKRLLAGVLSAAAAVSLACAAPALAETLPFLSATGEAPEHGGGHLNKCIRERSTIDNWPWPAKLFLGCCINRHAPILWRKTSGCAGANGRCFASQVTLAHPPFCAVTLGDALIVLFMAQNGLSSPWCGAAQARRARWWRRRRSCSDCGRRWRGRRARSSTAREPSLRTRRARPPRASSAPRPLASTSWASPRLSPSPVPSSEVRTPPAAAAPFPFQAVVTQEGLIYMVVLHSTRDAEPWMSAHEHRPCVQYSLTGHFPRGQRL